MSVIEAIQKTDENKYSIVILDSFGFPYGMASTQRVGLILRALVENGKNVIVLCVRAQDRQPNVENQEISGVFHGINFEYTPGTTVRSRSFWKRRYYDIKGILIALFRLIQYSRKGEIGCIYYYGNILSNSLNRWIFYGIAKILQVPLIIEMCERPWVMAKKNAFNSLFDPLLTVDGVIVISSYLDEWLIQEKKNKNRNFRKLKLPILMDLNESVSSSSAAKEFPKNVLYAGSPNYQESMEFILDSMNIVWEKYPDCKLTVTGYREGEVGALWLQDQVKLRNIEDKIFSTGYLQRSVLFEYYQKATALLIPLFDDVRSKARFPTKIGEYLNSGNPIVTNNVGEIPNYFMDGINAYVCDPGDPYQYAQKIIEAISPQNVQHANEVGNYGKKLAEKCFYYKRHENSIVEFFSSFYCAD